MAVAQLITPWFLDTPRPALAALDRPGASIAAAAPLQGTTQQAAIAPVHRAIADFVATTCTRGDVPASLAGDCCAAIPVLAGLQRAGIDPMLVWLDAHGDFNTWQTTPSGFLGGMPLAMIAGRGEDTLMANAGAQPIAERQITLADARDLDPLEHEALAASEVAVFGNLANLVDGLPAGAPVWVHFDCDLITSDEVPAQSYPVAGGPGAAEVARCLAGLAARTRVVAGSMSAWNPDLDTGGRAGRICLDCFDELLCAL